MVIGKEGLDYQALIRSGSEQQTSVTAAIDSSPTQCWLSDDLTILKIAANGELRSMWLALKFWFLNNQYIKYMKVIAL